MVDRKLYSRSREKVLLHRVVDEELYRPDEQRGSPRDDRGIADLLQRGSGNGPAHHRHRLIELTLPERPAGPVALPVRSAGVAARLWRRLVSLLSWRG